MERRYILCGPPGIGKTRHAETLAELLGCRNIVDDWNGRDDLPAGTLAITHGEFFGLPAGAVAFRVEDADGLDALVRAFRPSAPSERPAVPGMPA